MQAHSGELRYRSDRKELDRDIAGRLLPHFCAVARHEQGDIVGGPVGPALGHEPPHLILGAVEMLKVDVAEQGCGRHVCCFHLVPEEAESLGLVGSQVSGEPYGQSWPFGRDPQVDLIAEGADGLRRLAAVADALVTRHGGCSGCTLQKTCGTCMPLASLYRQAKAPLEVFCQHGRR